MLLVQLTGLSGSGKSTIASVAAAGLQQLGYAVELIDGDEYRKHLCADLGFSKTDRLENIRRLGSFGSIKAREGKIVILAAINPYEAGRKLVAGFYETVKLVYIRCNLERVIERDTKQFYRRALLPHDHPDHLANFTGINDPFEEPSQPDLVIETADNDIRSCAEILINFILSSLK